jgi:hypothetical protein
VSFARGGELSGTIQRDDLHSRRPRFGRARELNCLILILEDDTSGFDGLNGPAIEIVARLHFAGCA